MSFEIWKDKISSKLENLTEDHKLLLLEATNTTTRDELIFKLSQRYPNIDPAEVFERHPEYLNEDFLLKSIKELGSYKDSPDHDKTSGNYGRSYDRWINKDFERVFVKGDFKVQAKKENQ